LPERRPCTVPGSIFGVAGAGADKNAGVYHVCGSVMLMNPVPVEIDLFIDGTRFRAMAGGSTGSCGGCLDVRLDAGQRAQLQVYQISAAVQTVRAEALWSYINIHRVF
jgi:hypothetical protein